MKMTQIQQIKRKAELRIFFRILVITAVVFFMMSGSAAWAEQKEQMLTELPQPDIPQPQLFCGYCHVLTYPGIVQKGYNLWKKGKHNQIGCVECHYPPKASEIQSKTVTSESVAAKKHIPKSPPERFSYVQLGGETIKTRPRIIDASCMTASCHGKPDDDFKTKKIKFTEKVLFVHKPHLEKKNQIEGQQVNCTSCHQHETDKKKFEVSQAVCFLCHFKNTKFADGRGKCDLCHQLPEKPIQTSGEKPITHKMLQDAKVQCGSCHYDMISRGGQVKYELVIEGGEIKNAQIMVGGEIKKEACSSCHDREKHLKEVSNKKLMHAQHVMVKNARCLDCHRVIQHQKADVEKPLLVRKDCSACHPDHHKYQELLIKGPKRKDVSKTPDPMFQAMTNCLGCHVEGGMDKKGEKTLKASGKMCVACHTKDHDKMLKSWIDEVVKNVKDARELETEAKEAIAKHAKKIPEEKLKEFKELLKEGQNNLRIVKFGNGVHNKKYAMLLIDSAMNNFEDIIDELEE